MKIVNVVGARPNLPKIAPLMKEMNDYPEIEPILVHTGQHYDDALSDVFFREMGIPKPDVNLGVGSGSHAVQTAEVLRGMEPVLIKAKPDLVLVVGDVNSTLAVTLCAAKLGIKIAHVEAGLQSFDRSMPEEINRILTDALATYLFVTKKDAIENLRNEGRSATSIHFVGNVMVDSLMRFLPAAQKSPIGHDLGVKLGEKWGRFGILTLHRPSNVASPGKLISLLRAVEALATADYLFRTSAHPRTPHSKRRRTAPPGASGAPIGLSRFHLSAEQRLLGAHRFRWDPGRNNCAWCALSHIARKYRATRHHHPRDEYFGGD